MWYGTFAEISCALCVRLCVSKTHYLPNSINTDRTNAFYLNLNCFITPYYLPHDHKLSQRK